MTTRLALVVVVTKHRHTLETDSISGQDLCSTTKPRHASLPGGWKCSQIAVSAECINRLERAPTLAVATQPRECFGGRRVGHGDASTPAAAPAAPPRAGTSLAEGARLAQNQNRFMTAALRGPSRTFALPLVHRLTTQSYAPLARACHGQSRNQGIFVGPAQRARDRFFSGPPARRPGLAASVVPGVMTCASARSSITAGSLCRGCRQAPLRAPGRTGCSIRRQCRTRRKTEQAGRNVDSEVRCDHARRVMPLLVHANGPVHRC